MGAAVGAGFAASDALLMGATLCREWAAYWPISDGELATTMNDITKYVVSDSLPRAGWANSTLFRRAEAAERIRALKAGPGKDIAVSGSATLVRWLLCEGLLDELNLLVQPLLVGSGKQLFEEGTPHLPLQLVSFHRLRQRRRPPRLPTRRNLAARRPGPHVEDTRAADDAALGPHVRRPARSLTASSS
jgi:dihydrofolate reductase